MAKLHLSKFDPDRELSHDRYEELLKIWQLDLLSLQQAALRTGLRAIVQFEGWDAAGKGGSIRRMVERLDPRGYRVYTIGAPEKWEQSRHYLYRFWTRMPPPGELAIFDRSWYGRVLVERVEGFAPNDAWKRAYRELNELERWLVDDGVVLVKFWFHIDPDEQLKRFHERESSPFKAWKMSTEDWRNRGKWDAYVEAADDMFKHTDTDHCPWTPVPANNKRFARIYAIQCVADALRKAARKTGRVCAPAPKAKYRLKV